MAQGAQELVADGIHGIRPAQTSFVGREREKAEISRLLGARQVVTIVGVGGAGKTRLSLEIARDIAAGFPEGVWLIELAALSSPEFLASTVLEALGVRDRPPSPAVETLIGHLSSRRLLLVLDNCEHVLGMCRELVVRVTNGCREVVVLATSREPLRVPGEQIWPLDPLDVPAEGSDFHAVAAAASAQLFADRAAAARPDFALTRENAAEVSAVCRGLAGIPLAVELVAPWTRALTLVDIQARLRDLVRIPPSSPPSGDYRHVTMERTLEWSYELLPDAQQQLFRRLGIFVGGFTLDAAETVASVPPMELLGDLGALVEKSLVMSGEGTDGATRYRLLQPVREFAASQLLPDGEREQTHRRHAEFYAALAERADRGLRRSDQLAWLARLDEEHDNLRAAMAWSIDSDHAELSLRLAGHLWWYWMLRGRNREGRERVRQAVEMAGGPERLRARALLGLASFECGLGGTDVMLTAAKEAIAAYQQLGDRLGQAVSLATLARASSDAGDYDNAAAFGTQALELFKKVEAPGGLAWTLLVLIGPAAASGDLARCRALADEALALYRSRHDRWGIGWALVCLGTLTLVQGDPRAARESLENGVRLFQELDSRDEAVVYGWSMLASALIAMGQLDTARQHALAAWELAERLGNPQPAASALARLAELYFCMERYELAAQLLGAFEAMWDPSNARLLIKGGFDHATTCAALSARIGREEFDEARTRGATLTSREISALLADDPPPTEATDTAASEHAAALFRREGEYWCLANGGTVFRLRDSKGLHYMAHLLGKPGAEFHVLDLVATVEPAPPGAGLDRGTAGPLLDAQAKSAYRRRLAHLEAELDDALAFGDELRAGRMREEREFLAAELARAVGLGGRDRHAAAASERARVKVTRLLRDVTKRVGVHDPAFGSFLDRAVRTGTYCAYEPPDGNAPAWQF